MIADALLLQPVVLREWAAAGIFILKRENSQKLHTPRKQWYLDSLSSPTQSDEERFREFSF